MKAIQKLIKGKKVNYKKWYGFEPKKSLANVPSNLKRSLLRRDDEEKREDEKKGGRKKKRYGLQPKKQVGENNINGESQQKRYSF